MLGLKAPSPQRDWDFSVACHHDLCQFPLPVLALYWPLAPTVWEMQKYRNEVCPSSGWQQATCQPLSVCTALGYRSYKSCWALSTVELPFLQKPLQTHCSTVLEKSVLGHLDQQLALMRDIRQQHKHWKVQTLGAEGIHGARNEKRKKMIKNWGSILCYLSERPRGLGISLAKEMVEILPLVMFKNGHEKMSPENVCGDQMDEITWLFKNIFFIPHSLENLPPQSWPDCFSVSAGT